MGLDIYSGQMTRYYCRNWETIVQQQAKEDGIECELITPTGKIKPVRDQTEINCNREFIGGWMEHIAERLKLPVAPPLWDEYKECGYYTDKPDWEAFGALALVQSCLCLDRPCPEFIENGYNAYVDPAVKEAEEQKTPISLLRDVGIWLPIPDDIIVNDFYPTNERGMLSTVSLLKHELEELNRRLWQADEQTILSWRNDKYYYPANSQEPEETVEPEKPKRLFGLIPWKYKSKKRVIERKEIFRTEDLAQCAYSILYQAVRFAEENQVPIILDY